MARLSPRAARGPVTAALWLRALAAITTRPAAWVAGETPARQERENLDTRLAASLRVGREEFADVLAEAERRADQLARSEPVQRALAAEDRAAACWAASSSACRWTVRSPAGSRRQPDSSRATQSRSPRAIASSRPRRGSRGNCRRGPRAP